MAGLLIYDGPSETKADTWLVIYFFSNEGNASSWTVRISAYAYCAFVK